MELTSSNQVKIERKMISNVPVLVYTCYSCMNQIQDRQSRNARLRNVYDREGEFPQSQVSRVTKIEESQKIKSRTSQKDLEDLDAKCKELEKKETDFRQKIVKHTETLHRIRAENDSILSEINRMRAERNNQKDILSSITVELESINKSIEESKDKKDEKIHPCAICLDNERDHAIVDCGHTLCQVCVPKIVDKGCPICQVVITKMIKIYLS